MTEQEIRDLLRSIDKLAKEHDRLKLYSGYTFQDLAEVVSVVATHHLGADLYNRVIEEEYERAMSNDDAK